MTLIYAKNYITEAEPAVTRPFFLNKVGSLFNPSIVVWGLGCSSISTETSFLFSTIVTGQISCLNLPASCAKVEINYYHKIYQVIKKILPCFQSCCDRKANLSTSSRWTPHCSPSFSAVKAIGSLQ